jgi:hypothetical protein
MDRASKPVPGGAQRELRRRNRSVGSPVSTPCTATRELFGEMMSDSFDPS